MPDKIITLTSFSFPAEAYSLISRLEQEDIESFIGDENIVSVYPVLSNAVGGVKVNIKEKDLEKALLILNQSAHNNKNPEEKVEEKWEEGFVLADTFCPECESSRVYRKKNPFYKVILAIIFAPVYLLFVLLTKKQYYCADCGHIWKQ